MGPRKNKSPYDRAFLFLCVLHGLANYCPTSLGATLMNSFFGQKIFSFDWYPTEVDSTAKTLGACATHCTQDGDTCSNFAFDMNAQVCSRGNIDQFPMTAAEDEMELIYFKNQMPEDGPKGAIALMSRYSQIFHNASGTKLINRWIPDLDGDICAAFSFDGGILAVLRTQETYHIKFGSRIWKYIGNTYHGSRSLTAITEVMGQYWMIGGNVEAPVTNDNWDKDTTEYFDGKEWNDGFALPNKIREAKVVKVSGTEGFLFGGVRDGAHNFDTYMIDFDSWTLTPKAAIPIGSTIHCAGSFILDGKFTVASVGGWMNTGVQGTHLQLYDVASDSWSSGTDAPRPPTATLFLPFDDGLVLFDNVGALKYEYKTNTWINNWPDGTYKADFGYLNIPILYNG